MVPTAREGPASASSLSRPEAHLRFAPPSGQRVTDVRRGSAV